MSTASLTRSDDAIARRCYVSRTALYFYFSNKRAVIDRLIQQVFADMLTAARPYLGGGTDPRSELRQSLGRVSAVVNREASILLLAAQLSGREDRLPPEWEPYIRRFVRAAAERIARDQQRGVAPTDIPPGIAAQALCSMVEVITWSSRRTSPKMPRLSDSVPPLVKMISAGRAFTSAATEARAFSTAARACCP